MFRTKSYQVKSTTYLPKLSLSTAEVLAEEYLKKLQPYIFKGMICGSIRRKSRECGDVELVVIPKFGMETVQDLFKEPQEVNLLEIFMKKQSGIQMGGNRYKKIHLPLRDTQFGKLFLPDAHYQVDVFITNLNDYGRIVTIRTGSEFYVRTQIAAHWWRMGWAGTEDGLRRKAECNKLPSGWKVREDLKDKLTLPPEFYSEQDFWSFLHIPYVEPERRNWDKQY